jgi:hypothetical protein
MAVDRRGVRPTRGGKQRIHRWAHSADVTGAALRRNAPPPREAAPHASCQGRPFLSCTTRVLGFSQSAGPAARSPLPVSLCSFRRVDPRPGRGCCPCPPDRYDGSRTRLVMVARACRHGSSRLPFIRGTSARVTHARSKSRFSPPAPSPLDYSLSRLLRLRHRIYRLADADDAHA